MKGSRQGKRGFFVVSLLLLGLLFSALGLQAENIDPVWNVDPEFDFRPFDTGNLQEVCFVHAPEGCRSWGVEAATFNGADDHTISAARFRSNGKEAYLYGRNMKPGRAWGFVRYTQGDAMNGFFCGPQNYSMPRPGSLSQRRIILEFDLFLDHARLLTQSDSWIMAAVNIWFTMPGFPDGKDNKPLVLDLFVYHESNMSPLPAPHESRFALHYPVKLTPALHGQWKSWHLDITDRVQSALHHDYPGFVLLDRRGERRPGLHDLKVRQLDLVLELVNAEAAATIDNVRLLLMPEDTTPGQGFAPGQKNR